MEMQKQPFADVLQNNFIKKTPKRVFSCEYCKLLGTALAVFFYRTPLVAACGNVMRVD